MMPKAVSILRHILCPYSILDIKSRKYQLDMAKIVSSLLIMIILAANPSLLHADFLKEGRIGHYEFECNTEDSGQTGATLIEFGDPECVDEGKLLRAYRFDGDDALLFPNNSSSPYYAITGFTWSVWINADSLPTANNSGFGMSLVSFADQRDGRDAYLGFGSPYTNKRELTFLVDGAGGAGGSAFLRDGICRYYPQGGFADSTWIHITGVRDYENNRVTLYLDGVPVASKTFEVDEPLSDNNPGAIAAYDEGDGPKHFFRGMMDEVRFYERAFTDEEVLKLYSLKPDQLRTDTDTVDFGELWCQEDTTITIDVYNIGPSKFDVTEIELSSGAAFAFSDPSPLTLGYPDGDTLSIDITFTPADSREYQDTIYFYNELDFPPLAIPISGRRAAFAVDTVRFAPQLICDSSFTYQFDFTLSDILQGNIAEIANITSSYTNLTIDKNAGDTLGLAANDSISITFSPKREEYLNEQLEFTFNDCFLRKKIVIEGAFIADSIEYPELVDFGVKPTGEILDTVVGIYYPPITKISDTGTWPISVLVDGREGFELVEWTEEEGMWRFSNDTVYVRIRGVAPSEEITRSFTLIFFSDCGQRQYVMEVSVNGQFVASGAISAPVITATSFGEEVEVAVDFSNLATVTESGISELSFDLVWNGSILTAPNNIPLTAEPDYKVRSRFSVAASELAEGRYTLFTGQAALGNTRQDSIWIENISAEGGYFDFTAEAGQITLDVPGFNAEDMLLFDISDISVSLAPNPIEHGHIIGIAEADLPQSGNQVPETLEAHYSVIDINGHIISQGIINLNREFDIKLPEGISTGAYIINIRAGQATGDMKFQVEGR